MTTSIRPGSSSGPDEESPPCLLSSDLGLLPLLPPLTSSSFFPSSAVIRPSAFRRARSLGCVPVSVGASADEPSGGKRPHKECTGTDELPCESFGACSCCLQT